MKVLLITLMLTLTSGNPAPDPQDIHLHFHEGESQGLQPSSTHHDSTKKDGVKKAYPWNSRGLVQDTSKNLYGLQGMKRTEMYDSQEITKTDSYGSKGIKRPDLIGSQGIKRPDFYGLKRIRKPDMYGSKGIEKKDMYGPQGIKKPDMYGSQGIKNPDIYRPQGIKKPDLYGSQGIIKPDMYGSQWIKRSGLDSSSPRPKPGLYDAEHGSDYADFVGHCDCRAGAGLIGAIPPECCKRKRAGAATWNANLGGVYWTIWDDEQCDNVGQGSKSSLEDCKVSCRNTDRCTAVNWRLYPEECVMRACPLPVQEPTWLYKNYRGYVLD